MPKQKLIQLSQRRNAGAQARRILILDALSKPRTQAELRDLLGMSDSGILHLLRRMQSEGLVRPAERIANTRIWEAAHDGAEVK
jgi:DNA-binding IclR family transcriptional regulator